VRGNDAEGLFFGNNMNNLMRKHKNQKSLLEMLASAKIDNDGIVAWRMINNKKMTVNVHVKIIRKFRDEMIIETENDQVENLEKLISGAEYLNFFISGFGLLFQSKIKSYQDKNQLIVSVPNEYAQLERRKYLRYQLTNESIECFITFQENGTVRKLKKRAFDISAGGISFIVSRLEAKFFNPGVKLEDFIFQIESKFVKTTARVVNIVYLEPEMSSDMLYGGWKVSISFLSNEVEFIKLVDDFVFSKINNIALG
jgi:c-di-GMP-binding flagellar brake protein YcgR